MRCCRGGRNRGVASQKSGFTRIWAETSGIRPNFCRKIVVAGTKLYGGGELCRGAALCRPPWFVGTKSTHGGEFGYTYMFLCRTISKTYIIVLFS